MRLNWLPRNLNHQGRQLRLCIKDKRSAYSITEISSGNIEKKEFELVTITAQPVIAFCIYICSLHTLSNGLFH